MGELTGPSSTDSPHSSPSSSSIIPPVSSAFLYNSMISATHGGNIPHSPPPPNLIEEDEADSCGTTYYRSSGGETRKAREFIPDSKKDEKYWERRRKNNEAAKRSREKRRQNDALMEHEIAELKHQNEILMRENCALLREIAALKGKDPGSVEAATPPIQPPPPTNGIIPAALNTLDLLGLQRLLTAFSNGSGNVANPVPTVVANPVVVNGSGLDDSPLDLSGGKIPIIKNCLPSPNSHSIADANQIGKLTELAVLTSTSPQTTMEGSYSTNRPQSVSWNSTPNPITPPACNGLQALISAAALTASPLISEANCSMVASDSSRTTTSATATPSWDVHQASPCLPLGLQPPPQHKMENSNESTPRRRNGSIRSPSTQYDDERYRERRRKNNEAVRRCRENKRARLSMRDEVTGRLQSDNILLRSKIDGLNSEVRALRHLLLAGQQQTNVPQTVKDEPQGENIQGLAEMKPQPECGLEEKPLPKYALPKKGIPRIPCNNSSNGSATNHLPPLKRRITLPPTFNPLAAIPFEGTSGLTN